MLAKVDQLIVSIKDDQQKLTFDLASIASHEHTNVGLDLKEALSTFRLCLVGNKSDHVLRADLEGLAIVGIDGNALILHIVENSPLAEQPWIKFTSENDFLTTSVLIKELKYIPNAEEVRDAALKSLYEWSPVFYASMEVEGGSTRVVKGIVGGTNNASLELSYFGEKLSSANLKVDHVDFVKILRGQSDLIARLKAFAPLRNVEDGAAHGVIIRTDNAVITWRVVPDTWTAQFFHDTEISYEKDKKGDVTLTINSNDIDLSEVLRRVETSKVPFEKLVVGNDYTKSIKLEKAAFTKPGIEIQILTAPEAEVKFVGFLERDFNFFRDGDDLFSEAIGASPSVNWRNALVPNEQALKDGVNTTGRKLVVGNGTPFPVVEIVADYGVVQILKNRYGSDAFNFELSKRGTISGYFYDKTKDVLSYVEENKPVNCWEFPKDNFGHFLFELFSENSEGVMIFPIHASKLHDLHRSFKRNARGKQVGVNWNFDVNGKLKLELNYAGMRSTVNAEPYSHIEQSQIALLILAAGSNPSFLDKFRTGVTYLDDISTEHRIVLFFESSKELIFVNSAGMKKIHIESQLDIHEGEPINNLNGEREKKFHIHRRSRKLSLQQEDGSVFYWDLVCVKDGSYFVENPSAKRGFTMFNYKYECDETSHNYRLEGDKLLFASDAWDFKNPKKVILPVKYEPQRLCSLRGIDLVNRIALDLEEQFTGSDKWVSFLSFNQDGVREMEPVFGATDSNQIAEDYVYADPTPLVQAMVAVYDDPGMIGLNNSTTFDHSHNTSLASPQV